MHFKKLISLWALLALMLGQAALIQHSATHIDHGISFELVSSHSDTSNHNHSDQEESDKHQCPECVLTKSLQAAFYNSSSVLLLSLQAEAIEPTQQSLMIAINRYQANAPRAPPAILI